MSLKAMIWVAENAPVYNTGRLAVLYALADRASDDGTGAWPSQDWIAYRARCDARTVRRHLKDLEAAGIIRRGDQRLVSYLPSNHRPVVWDLNMALTREDHPGQNDRPTGSVDPVGRSECPPGQNARADNFDTQAGHSEQSGRTPVSYKPSLTIHEPSKGVTENGNVTRGGASSSLPSPEIPPVWIADPRRARCAAHAGVEHPPACRGCADARGAAEVARDAVEARKAADAASRRAAIDACTLCDPNGLAEGPNGLIRCPHTPDGLQAAQDAAGPGNGPIPAFDETRVDTHTPAPAYRRWKRRHANRVETLGSETVLPAIEHDDHEPGHEVWDEEDA